MAAIFQPDLLDWLFGSGIGTNIGASILWAFAAGLIGYQVARWFRAHVRALHARLDLLHKSHKALHEKLDALTPGDARRARDSASPRQGL